jgi:hypothetical protein
LPFGPQTKSRDHSDATGPGLRALETFRYLLFFVSYILSEIDRHFSVLHIGCHMGERTSVSVEMGLMQRLRAVRKSGAGIYWISKTSFGVEPSTLCRALVELREVDPWSKRLLKIEM